MTGKVQFSTKNLKGKNANSICFAYKSLKKKFGRKFWKIMMKQAKKHFCPSTVCRKRRSLQIRSLFRGVANQYVKIVDSS